MALRLSGQLLLGASRIYWRKARYLFEDCNETLDRLKLNFKIDGQVDMPQDQSRAAISSITLATNYTSAANNLMLPEPDLDLDEILNMVATQQPQTSGKPGNGKENDNSINLKGKFNINNNFGFDKSDQNDSILQAFPMNEDFEIETGRRLTDLSALGMSRDSNPFISRDSISTSAFGLEEQPSGIEAGRRESIASAYSPMRISTPGQAAKDEHMDFDINDNFSWDNADEQNAASPLGAALFSTPPRPVVNKATRKRRVALDEITELTNTQIQKQVKDTSDIIMIACGKGKRAGLGGTIFATEELRRLSIASMTVPEDAAAILARPAFDGDMLMDAFGDLFKDNPLAIASASVVTPVISRIASSALLQSEITPIQNTFTDINDDHLYEDMNPEPAFFDAEPTINRDSVASAASSQINILEIISSAVERVHFSTVMANQTRSVVAKSFFDVLALSSKGKISAHQSEAFGHIILAAN